MFFIRRFGEPRLRFDLPAQGQIAEKRSLRKDRREKIAEKRSLRKELSILQGENDKMCLPFRCSRRDDDGAHSYLRPPRSPDEVLVTLRLSEPCGIGRSFWGASHIAEKRFVPASWQREKGGQHVSTDSDVSLD